MAKVFLLNKYAIYFYILTLIITSKAGGRGKNRHKGFKIDHIKMTTRKPQPIFGYVKHVVDLNIYDYEYSKNESIYIPASGVIIAPRFVLTAAHLIKRGRVVRVEAHHRKCNGDKSLGWFSFGETHDNYKGKPPFFDIAVLLLHHNIGFLHLCEELKPVRLPKTFLAYNFGGRAILVGNEFYYQHFIFTTRRTKATPKTTTTKKDPRYYSSEYYSDTEDSQPCCSTPKMMRLLRRKERENVIRIQHCPADIDGYFFCSYEQNRTIPNEGDLGTGVIDRFGRLIGIFSFQRWVTYGSNVNFFVDVAASMNWINKIMPEILEKEKEYDGDVGGHAKDDDKTMLRLLS